MTQPPPGGDTYNLSGDFRGAILNIKSTINGQPRETRIPWQRPPRAEHFTGRDAELAQLLAELQPGRVAALCGPGGIGKSALAAEAVWTLAPANEPSGRFPDGFIFHSFYNQPQADLALAHIARSYGEEPAQGSLRDAALRALAGKQALLLLDGTEEADDLAAVLSIRGSCAVLVTSRRREDAVAGRQDIKPLPPAEAIHLLQAWGKRQAGQPEVAGRICELVGRLPLAVRLVGRYLDQGGETAGDYLEWLEQTPLQALDHGRRRHQSVPLLLARSLDQVSETARQVLAVAGLLALAPFRREVIGVALELPEAELRRALAHLVNYGLLERTETGAYQPIHALIHIYAREQLAPPAGAAGRLAAYYEAFAQEQTQQGLAGYTRLDAERPHLLRLLAGCADRADWAAARALVWSINPYLNIRGHTAEWVTALNIGLEAAKVLGHRDDEGAFLGNLGIAYNNLGQVEKAIEFYKQVLAISREMDDRQSEGGSLGNLGVAYYALGQVEQAIEFYEQALAISRELGHRQGEGSDLGNLGTAYYNQGQVEKAIEYYEQALAISRELGHRQSVSSLLGNLGLVYSNLGQVKKAIEYYRQALAISREIGNRQGEGNHLGNLGNAYRILGQVEKAIKYHEQALAISREIGDQQGEGSHLSNLGLAYSDLGQAEKAIGYYEQALAISRELGHRQGEGNRLGNLGAAYYTLGQVEKAIEYYKQALAISREIGHRHSEGSLLGNLGVAYRDLGQVEKAIEYCKQALFISRKIGDRQGEGNHLVNLGNAYHDLGQVGKAIGYYEQALAISREIGDRQGAGVRFSNIGLAYSGLGQVEQARRYLRRALAIFEEIKSPNADQVREWLRQLEQ